MPATTILLADTDEQILRCFPVLAQLRQHLEEQEFVARVRRQERASGYRLAFLEDNGAVCAVAGFRIAEFLAWGKILYVDDLVTDSLARSHGHGEQLFTWLAAHAQAAGCAELHLDSGVQRFAAHRFYLRQRMDITSYHFTLALS